MIQGRLFRCNTPVVSRSSSNHDRLPRDLLKLFELEPPKAN